MRTILRCAAALALLALGACGSGGGATPAPSPSTMSDAEILAIGKQAAQCIRENGIPEFPDPYVERGRLKLPEDQAQTLESKYAPQVMDQAQQACQSILDRLPESAISDDNGGNQQVPGPGDVEALRKFAQCMRENGIPEFPDPKADGTFPARGTALETEGKSDRMLAGFKACQQFWNGGLTFS